MKFHYGDHDEYFSFNSRIFSILLFLTIIFPDDCLAFFVPAFPNIPQQRRRWVGKAVSSTHVYDTMNLWAHSLSNNVDSDAVVSLEVDHNDKDISDKTYFVMEETQSTSSSSAISDTIFPSSESISMIDNNKLFIASLGAITGRGEHATEIQHRSAKKVITELEQNNPTKQPCQSDNIIGTWELLYSNTELFRSSPFFMSGRAVCQNEDQRDQYDFFCKMHRLALAISNIGSVRQVISSQRLISEFEVKVGAIPFLSDLTPLRYSGGIPIMIEGAIVSTADIVSTNPTNWELYMDTVEIKGSNIPILRQLVDMDQIKLPSRTLGKLLEDNSSVIQSILPNYQTPRPVFLQRT